MRIESFESAVEVRRADGVESIHAAAIAAVDAEGGLIASLGDPDLVIFLRSSAKPFQAAAVVCTGAAERYGLTTEEIALMAGSHAGEDRHAAAAASMLARVGLGPSDLGCGTHTPFDRATAERLTRHGERPDVLRHNCSGKHAGMLAAARHLGEDVGSYLDREHAVQKNILRAISQISGRPSSDVRIAVDGCSAPTFGVSLKETAVMFARLLARETGGGRDLESASAQVVSAMQAHPEMVAGERLLDTALMRAVPGSIAKGGAEGVHAMAWIGREGPVAMAVKIMDGDTGRGRTATLLGALSQMGVQIDTTRLPASVADPLTVRTFRGAKAGDLRPIFTLRRH